MENARKVLADEQILDVDIRPDYYLKFYKSYTHMILLNDRWKCMEVFDIIDALDPEKYGITERTQQFEMIYHN